MNRSIQALSSCISALYVHADMVDKNKLTKCENATLQKELSEKVCVAEIAVWRWHKWQQPTLYRPADALMDGMVQGCLLSQTQKYMVMSPLHPAVPYQLTKLNEALKAAKDEPKKSAKLEAQRDALKTQIEKLKAAPTVKFQKKNEKVRVCMPCVRDARAHVPACIWALCFDACIWCLLGKGLFKRGGQGSHVGVGKAWQGMVKMELDW